MGCGASSPDKGGADDVNWRNCQNDEDFERENNKKRARFDKKTGKATTTDMQDKPEFDIFEAQDAGEGEQFMAVKPWIGSVVAPTNPPEVNTAEPDVNYSLDWVFGYRAEDSRQNLFLNSSG